MRCVHTTDPARPAIVAPTIGGYGIWYQQLVAALRLVQQLLQRHGDALIFYGDGAYLAALALHSEGVFTQRVFGGGGVHTEALVDAQTGVAGQIQGEDIVLTPLRHGTAQQLAELGFRPCAVLLPEAAALQFHAQCAVVWQCVFRVGHLIVEKADSG